MRTFKEFRESNLRYSVKFAYQKGGKMNGPSHVKGGIDINVEGGEYIIKKSSVNGKTEAALDYINNNAKLPPSINAKDRRNNAKSGW